MYYYYPYNDSSTIRVPTLEERRVYSLGDMLADAMACELCYDDEAEAQALHILTHQWED